MQIHNDPYVGNVSNFDVHNISYYMPFYKHTAIYIIYIYMYPPKWPATKEGKLLQTRGVPLFFNQGRKKFETNASGFVSKLRMFQNDQ